MQGNIFFGYPYKKISCFQEKKELQFVFDFPNLVDEKFDVLSEKFLAQTGWRVFRNSEPNEYAIQTFLTEQLGENLRKISIRKQEKSVTITFYQPEVKIELESLSQEFERLTGYHLYYEGKKSVIHGKIKFQEDEKVKNDIYPETQIDPIEQNLAFSCIEAEFEEEQVRPCKKGIQTDAEGKFLQIAFLSPQLGRKVQDTLQRIANQTGWRIRIADSVNQNAIITYTNQICKSHQVVLRKNPSYLPDKQVLLLKPVNFLMISEDIREAIETEILEKTGLILEWEN